MSEKYYIEIDASPWMDKNGINVSVYLGESCEPNFERIWTYEELIDSELDAHTVRGKLTNEYGHDNIGTAEKSVIALEEAAVYARKRFEELQNERSDDPMMQNSFDFVEHEAQEHEDKAKRRSINDASLKNGG